jgi:hypothetical protein
MPMAGTNCLYFYRRATVSNSCSVSSGNSPLPTEKAPSTHATAPKTSAKPQTLEEWVDQSIVEMEGLGRDEIPRREIASNLADP